MWQITLSEILMIPSAVMASLPSIIVQALSMTLTTTIVYFYGGLLLAMCVYMVAKTTYESHNKFACITEFFSFTLMVLMELTWSNLDIYNKYNGLILVNFGVIASTIVCKIIICSVTKVLFLFNLDEIWGVPSRINPSGGGDNASCSVRFDPRQHAINVCYFLGVLFDKCCPYLTFPYHYRQTNYWIFRNFLLLYFKQVQSSMIF